LQILTALIEKLPRELPLYARSVLTVIDTVLRSNDISMVEESVPTFETLCNSQDLAVLAAEQQYATQYQNIIRTYAACASPTSNPPSRPAPSPPVALRWRNVGLKAIKSVVGSEALGADSEKQLGIVVPVILENLYAGGEDILVSLQSRAQSNEKAEREQIRRRRTSTATVQTVDAGDGNIAEASGTAADADKAAEIEVRLLAMRCLERIFVVSSHRPQIRIAAGLVLQFIVNRYIVRKGEQELEEIGVWAESLMQLIAKWCPVQDRFIILITAVEVLRGIPVDEHLLNQQIILASLIDSLLKSPINMIGLSVIDVLAGFIQHISRLLQSSGHPSSQPRPASKELNEKAKEAATKGNVYTTSALIEKQAVAEPPSAAVLSPTRQRLTTLLQQCIGDLATHIYYADQLADMIRTILKRIQPLSPSDIAADPLDKTVADPANSASTISNPAAVPQAESFFYLPPAKIMALEAIKNILVVANLRQSTAGAGVESRNKVGIQVWEGTQWLLRDSDRQVRCAYADAFVSWLQLETTRGHLKAEDSTKRMSRSQSKREIAGQKRSVSVSTAPVEKTQTIVPLNYLQLLHLALYDSAVEFATVDRDILVIHLILGNSIEHLGVNAARFGLPMVLELQSELATNESLRSAAAQINIGSLVYGYLSALSEKFDFESSKIGGEMQGEILKRKKRSAWLDKIRLPPLALSQIVETEESGPKPELQEPLSPFTATDELVRQIENAYTASLIAACQSPPSSPGRPSAGHGQGQGYFAAQDVKLPSDVREQMLSLWSRDAALAALERENTKASSITASRNGTSVRRNYGQLNGGGNGSPNGGGSPVTPHRPEHSAGGSHGLGSAASFHGYRRSSVPEGSHSPVTVSSRDSTIRVNDLKRMLTVTGNPNVRRSSPLRGRLDASGNGSIPSSSSESMVSGTFSPSEYDGESRPQSIREGRPSREGSETPKASAVNSSSEANEEARSLDRTDSYDIPPVPPLPPGLSIPGGFPADTSSTLSRHSSISPNSERPMTAPHSRKSGSIKGRTDGSSAAQHGRSLSGRKSRSSSNLQATGSKRGATSSGPDDRSRGFQEPRDTAISPRVDIEQLLDDILPRGLVDTGDKMAVSTSNHPAEPRRASDRRGISGGIGHPPY
jgi:hypothetical protein